MHERRAEMAREKAEAFTALPGGYGTLEELLEMITWAQLGIHKKLIKVVEEGFIKSGARNMVLSAVAAKELLTKMEVLSVYLKSIKLWMNPLSILFNLCSDLMEAGRWKNWVITPQKELIKF
ncbi:hypothetical protein BUALT_Bualt10G0126600 [Buddleja alternifolia]|uniref:cytokinin riboside 5'-monophosphate phosphoribohydrolase n=1 Tax=Buddleja alternifolia TaxID=168488 RepID=A0AAV6X970_9LAMI|nr:hypothetical protein BUALT_Bualt10G0126600 [Buddleja alternifolia]